MLVLKEQSDLDLHGLAFNHYIVHISLVIRYSIFSSLFCIRVYMFTCSNIYSKYGIIYQNPKECMLKTGRKC